jgi:hypothetical protein
MAWVTAGGAPASHPTRSVVDTNCGELVKSTLKPLPPRKKIELGQT